VALSVLALVVALLPAAVSRQMIRSTDLPAGAGAAGPVAVQVSLSHCGAGWASGSSGTESFLLHNSDVNPGDAYLVVPASGAVVAGVEDLAAGASASLTVTLGGGRYAFRCVIEDSDAVTGPTVSVSGSPAPAQDVPAVVPVSQADMIAPTKRYQAFVAGRLPVLAEAVRSVRSDVAVGDLAKARTDWLAAHLDYEELGAAYQAFGDADRAINGVPSGLPAGVADPAFTGFHRLEYGLWHGQSPAALQPVADRLLADVNGLEAAFRTAQIAPLDVAVRAHEITENALQFELTGQTDFGSGSNLATVLAQLNGTQELITVLSPLLRTRYPDLDSLQRQWATAVRDVESEHRGSSWTPVERLPRADRERIDADVSELAEMLAAVAAICSPRRTS
jgi:iron uptake system component EfeO